MAQLADILRTTEELWPRSGAEEWDAVGLVVGAPEDEVARVLLAVDAVQATAAEAVDSAAQLLIAHHPLLMRGVTSVAADRYKGAVVTRLIRGGCALLAAHTNADVVDEGTSAALANALGLTDVEPIAEARNGIGGIGRTGVLASPIPLRKLAERVAAVVPATAVGVRVAGDADALIRTVAVCGGAGDSLLAHPRVAASDVYITSDLRHHPASEAREQALLSGGPALIDVSHWASESLWLERAAAQLRERHPDLDVVVSSIRTDPWDFLVTTDAQPKEKQ
ncbi:dinuclear metal center protein, YbgI/SA1388 family [Paramicrobacterium humi]|uniref:GTP cyclohydrolase 1 type 2 homolog n=1 Tax=Paramicrobacterium humi TaxID=640635 RepID=A0A1H4QHV4_9MICO|nr:Nif3-like dinuclear metal center hexameric protein [Microbacterium humi]SEC19183.1 dinuclear metal center protein, YbgI/SA1388 family [Microbacterium humi]